MEDIIHCAEGTYITPRMLPQGVAHEFLKRGLLPEAIRKLTSLYAPRPRAILAALDRHMSDASWVRPEGGFFLGLTLPTEARSSDVRRLSLEEELLPSNGEGFYADGDGSHFVRLPYCALNEQQIEDAVTRLARAVRRVRSA